MEQNCSSLRIKQHGRFCWYLPGIGGICVCGVEAGVGGFRSPPSAMELLVD